MVNFESVTLFTGPTPNVNFSLKIYTKRFDESKEQMNRYQSCCFSQESLSQVFSKAKIKDAMKS